MMRRAACKAANPLKIRASLGPDGSIEFHHVESQSLKDQGKSRTTGTYAECVRIWLSQSLKDQGKSRTVGALKDYRSIRIQVAIP